MAAKDQLGKKVVAMTVTLLASGVVKALLNDVKNRTIETVATSAVSNAQKPVIGKVEQRKRNRLRNEAIYRLVDKLRVAGEAALALGDQAPNDERQRMVNDSAALRDVLHEQLADLHLSSGAQKSEVLDAIQTAIADADRLVTALSRWALNSPGAERTATLREAVHALDASENALLSALRKTRRRGPGKGENEGR